MDGQRDATTQAEHLSIEDTEKLLAQPTIPLAEVGQKFFGMKPQAAKAAARRGEIPIIKIGRKLLVPTGPLRKLLQIEEPQKAA